MQRDMQMVMHSACGSAACTARLARTGDPMWSHHLCILVASQHAPRRNVRMLALLPAQSSALIPDMADAAPELFVLLDDDTD